MTTVTQRTPAAPKQAPVPEAAASRRLVTAVRHAGLVLACAVVLFPVVFLFMGAFKSIEEFFDSPFGLPQSLNFDNFTRAWSEAELGHALLNSIIVTAGAVLISTVLASLAAWAIARFEFRSRTLLHVIFVGGLVVPVHVIMLPLFIMFRGIGLLGTVWPLVIVYGVFGLPLAVLVLVGFFQTFPTDLNEAAEIDGAGVLQTLWYVVLPVSRPALATVVILNGSWIWNDFFIGLLLSPTGNSDTTPVRIIGFFGRYASEWGLVFAAVVISALPVMLAYLLLSRQFIKGLTEGAIKG